MGKAARLHSRALSNAVKYALDNAAYSTWKQTRDELPVRFQIRNTWTKRSITYEKANPKAETLNMFSRVGSAREYMAKQEVGFVEQSKGKHGVPVPTGAASGEGRGAQVRRKRILRQKYLSRLKVAQGLYEKARSAATKGRKQAYAIALAMARREGRPVIYWESKRGRKGLYEIEGQSITMLYDLTHRTLRTAAERWLSQPSEAARRRLEGVFARALRFAFHKYRL